MIVLDDIIFQYSCLISDYIGSSCCYNLVEHSSGGDNVGNGIRLSYP